MMLAIVMSSQLTYMNIFPRGLYLEDAMRVSSYAFTCLFGCMPPVVLSHRSRSLLGSSGVECVLLCHQVARAELKLECDYTREADNQDRYRKMMGESRYFTVPGASMVCCCTGTHVMKLLALSLGSSLLPCLDANVMVLFLCDRGCPDALQQVCADHHVCEGRFH